MPSWSIGESEHERLEVELTSPFVWDSGFRWVTTRVRLVVGGFRADVAMNLLVDDLERFLSRVELIYRDLSGKAEFNTIEDQLQLTVTADGLGHIRVDGRIVDAVGRGNALSFAIEFDQTVLRRTITELHRAISELKDGAD